MTRFALVNPKWTFAGSIYFGCREPHLPLEFGYAHSLLQRDSHEVLLVDAQMEGLDGNALRERVRAFRPDVTVVTTAPSYLFWRCPPPELRVPRGAIRDVRDCAGAIVAVGPHGSATPAAALRKLGADAVIRGEFEDVLPLLGRTPRGGWASIPSVCVSVEPCACSQNTPHAADVGALPALHWPDEAVRRHRHHHHRFDAPPSGPGAEIEASRGCPWQCSFCAKENFRNRYRKRPGAVVLEELDGLLRQGVEYVYLIDETFMPDRELMAELAARRLKYGVQTRIDVWDDPAIELLGASGCVSVEVGVESISDAGRSRLDKRSNVPTAELTRRLALARKRIPFVQANLIAVEGEDPEEVERWRLELQSRGVWANRPVPLFPYPGSREYTRRWGQPDDLAWERAHEHYLRSFAAFSDIQDSRPLSLPELEATCDE